MKGNNFSSNLDIRNRNTGWFLRVKISIYIYIFFFFKFLKIMTINLYDHASQKKVSLLSVCKYTV